jgi:uncharacterized oligopeptide transporter (OPT) family protein
MLVPHVVAWSMMLGAVLSWGVMWPLLTVSAAANDGPICMQHCQTWTRAG